MEKVKTSPEPRQSEMYCWDWVKEPKEENMDRNFKVSIKEVLKHEEGWSDRPSDPSGIVA